MKDPEAIRNAFYKLMDSPFSADPTTVQQFLWEKTYTQYAKVFADV